MLLWSCEMLFYACIICLMAVFVPAQHDIIHVASGYDEDLQGISISGTLTSGPIRIYLPKGMQFQKVKLFQIK